MGGVPYGLAHVLRHLSVGSNRGGRPRKAEALKRLHGTARKDRKVKGTPDPKGKPKRPVGLSRQAIRIWDALGPQLQQLGLLTEIDSSTFGVYCQAYADWLQLTRHLNKLGPLNWYQSSESGYRQVIPEVGARNTAYQVMQRLETRFGLDPSSRASLSITETETAHDVVEEFLFKPRVIA